MAHDVSRVPQTHNPRTKVDVNSRPGKGLEGGSNGRRPKHFSITTNDSTLHQLLDVCKEPAVIDPIDKRTKNGHMLTCAHW